MTSPPEPQNRRWNPLRLPGRRRTPRPADGPMALRPPDGTAAAGLPGRARPARRDGRRICLVLARDPGRRVAQPVEHPDRPVLRGPGDLRVDLGTTDGVGALLFGAGSALAHLVVGEGLTVLLGFGGDSTVAALSPESCFTFLMGMLLIFGVSFELPPLLIMLNRIR